MQATANTPCAQRDDMRLRDLSPRVATLPLGSGALAGNPFGVDRQALARDLGMAGGVCPNSMDAVSDRDYVAETMFFASLHLVSDQYAPVERLHVVSACTW